jgi:hypothetical protein
MGKDKINRHASCNYDFVFLKGAILDVQLNLTIHPCFLLYRPYALKGQNKLFNQHRATIHLSRSNWRSHCRDSTKVVNQQPEIDRKSLGSK